jgi:hypothetical protein
MSATLGVIQGAVIYDDEYVKNWSARRLRCRSCASRKRASLSARDLLMNIIELDEAVHGNPRWAELCREIERGDGR